MIPIEVRACFRDALVTHLRASEIESVMEKAGIERKYVPGGNYYNNKPIKPTLVNEYYEFLKSNSRGDEKFLKAIELFLEYFNDREIPKEVEDLKKELEALKKRFDFKKELEELDRAEIEISEMESTQSKTEPKKEQYADDSKTKIKQNQELRDVFLCHASKDKNDFVEPLINKLSQENISFWYDEAEIQWGDSLISKINEGIKISRFVIIFLSKNFIERNWTEKEMNAALNIEINTGITKVLPLIIGDQDDERLILDKYPLLNDKKFKRWCEGIESITDELKKRLDFKSKDSIEKEHAKSVVKEKERKKRVDEQDQKEQSLDNEGKKPKGNKNLRTIVKIIIGVIITVLFIAIIGYTLLYKRQDVKSISIPGVKIEFHQKKVDKEKRISIQNPKIVISPFSFRLAYANPRSPSSLHGNIAFKVSNLGGEKADILSIKMSIYDGDRRITPPDEWNKLIGRAEPKNFYIPSYKSIIYAYNPEIGASGKNKIQLSIDVFYTNPKLDKSPTFRASYVGFLNYDKNIRVNYSGQDFVLVNKSPN